MPLRTPLCLVFLFGLSLLKAQVRDDAWISSHLNKIVWEKSYKGVLADYHPVTISLASDHNQICGYLIHQGDQRKHRLIGDWSRTDRFLLQEHDEYDRLTGYLTGSITNDQVQMEWMSADQSRLFSVKAFPESLIRIKNFKPVAETIQIMGATPIYLSVQKMDYGIVSGLTRMGRHLSRFEGYCLDGTCSIWNTVIQNPDGAPIRVQMRQRDATSYRATLNGTEYQGHIVSVTPLVVRQFDNSVGFLDFVYPKFTSTSFDSWLAQRLDQVWNEGTRYLNSINHPEQSGRLVHRSSGWIEILEEGESYVSGMFTFIHPGMTRREIFVWLRKEDAFLPQSELLNTTADLDKGAAQALASATSLTDEEYSGWLREAGYDYLLPTASGIVMSTEFNMVYGDDMRLLTPAEGKALIKKKYWRYFGW